MTFTYTKAERQKIGGLIGISGPSGSGKTRSAFHIAKGLANGSGSIACIDTESGRALHYAPKPGQKADSSKGTFDFHHVDFEPPFTPERYVEAIRFCEGNGATVIIFDSTSHEWAGEGGCADMQSQEAERMAKAAAAKSGRPWESMVEAMTAPAWSKPKQRHKRMVSKLLQSRAHLIFCLRAEEKIKIVDRKVVPIGFQPICEKSFPFELTCSMMLHPNNPGCPDYGLPYKLNDELQAIFPDGQRIGDEAGARLRGWLETGVERPAPDKIADGVRDLIEEIQDASDMAVLQEITGRARVKQQRTFLSERREDLATKVDEAVAERLAWFEQIEAGADEQDEAA